MSRIHEALSKAVRERERNGSAALSPALVEIAAQVNRPSIGAAEVFEPLVIEKREATSPSMEEMLKRCAHCDWKLDPRMSVFLPECNDKMGAERFRTLRSRLYQISDTKKLTRILITSTLPSEGKSFVCANLAQSMAQQQDRNVLVIDADLRKPTQHKIFGTPRGPGLADYLRGGADEYSVIHNGLQNNLFLIPAGEEVSNPSEQILSGRMKRLLEFSSEMFDWVIIDSAPALPVHDASILADLCEGVLFVVRAETTDFEMAARASAEFRKRNLLGVVFNCAEKEECSYGSYYA